MDIHLRTLGALGLRGPDHTELPSVLVQPKRVALLAYLAVARPRGFHRRDTLLALLWPDQDEEHARGALRQALYALRRSLGEGVLETRGEEVGAAPERFTCDVWEFEAAAESGRAQDAVALYGGELLPGFFLAGAPEFERWLEEERARLSRLYGRALEQVAEDGARAAPAAAVERWRRLAEHDPYSPRAALGLMQALAAAGDAPAAIRHAERHAALLRQELEAEPDPEVAALAERLRHRPAPALPGDAAPRPVPVPSSTAAAASPPPAPAAAPAVPRPRWPLRVAGALLVLLLVGTSPWWLPALGPRDSGTASVSSPAPAPERVALAVLPLANLSGEAADAYFSDGVTEELTTALANVEGLRVIDRASTAAFRGKDAELRRIADSLHVGYVVTGGVARSGARIRIEARLLDGRDGSVLWSDSYRRQVADLWAVQEEIARAIVAALERTLAPAGVGRLAASARPVARSGATRPPTASVRAYELYLRGHVTLNRWNQASVDSSIAALEAAVAADSSFAAARAALANAYLEKADVFDPREEWRSKAFVQTETALFMDSTLAEAHVARGNLLWTDANHFPHEAAARAFRRAAELKPSYAYAHDRLALVYLHVGLLDRALAEAREAVALDPLDLWARFRIGQILVSQMRFREAADELERLPPDVMPALRGSFLAQALIELGEPRRAEPMLRALADRFPRDPLVRATLALALAAGHDSAGAARARAAAAARVPGFAHGHHAEFAIALSYARLGSRDSALYWLERAARNGYPCYPRYAGDPLLAPLRGDPRYAALLRRLEAESEAYARTFAAGGGGR